jgi:phosphatidylserine/phosphatidylglycerophosphate/cardiolipin synthase-like enzyme
MLRMLEDKKKSGVDVRVIGSVSGSRLAACELKRMRLHTRTIIRDRTDAFVGSQSLRQLELDARREIGILLRDGPTVKSLSRTFEEDWAASSADFEEKQPSQRKLKKSVKKIAQDVTKKVPLNPVAKKVVKSIADHAEVDLDHKELRDTVKEILKDVVEQTAQDAAAEAAETVGKA